MQKRRRPETPPRHHHRRLQEVVLNRSIRLVTAAAALSLVAIAAGCDNKNDQPPQTAANQQYPNQQYPNQQYPNQQYPNQQYPNQQYPNQQYPQQQYPQGQYPQGQYPQQQPYPSQTAPQPTTTAPASTVPGLPGFQLPQIPGFPAPGGSSTAPGGTSPAPQGGQATGAATPIDPTLASAATGPLFLLAQSEAPGMAKEGPIVAGNFQQGQSLEQSIQLAPGKCYTVLAVGVGIQEMDVSLVLATPLPGMSPVLAQDSSTGATASLGGKGNCYKYPAPLAAPAKFVMVARTGQGMAAGQLYVK
jgi:hypothetical protein